MQQGKLPDCLEIAKVIPLFKSGDPCDLNNYRPISILTVISKVFERVVHNRIYRFFTGIQKSSTYSVSLNSDTAVKDQQLMQLRA